MPECEKCGYFKPFITGPYRGDACVSLSHLAPVFLNKDIYGKFIPHDKCPKKKKLRTGGIICLCCGQEIKKKQEN